MTERDGRGCPSRSTASNQSRNRNVRHMADDDLIMRAEPRNKREEHR